MSCLLTVVGSRNPDVWLHLGTSVTLMCSEKIFWPELGYGIATWGCLLTVWSMAMAWMTGSSVQTGARKTLLEKERPSCYLGNRRNWKLLVSMMTFFFFFFLSDRILLRKWELSERGMKCGWGTIIFWHFKKRPNIAWGTGVTLVNKAELASAGMELNLLINGRDRNKYAWYFFQKTDWQEIEWWDAEYLGGGDF